MVDIGKMYNKIQLFDVSSIATTKGSWQPPTDTDPIYSCFAQKVTKNKSVIDFDGQMQIRSDVYFYIHYNESVVINVNTMVVDESGYKYRVNTIPKKIGERNFFWEISVTAYDTQ